MTVGNLLALWQDNIRRLMAYSSIAHGGYMLIGLAAAFGATSAGGQISVDGIAALLFYLAVYVLATTGAFAALVYLGQPDRQADGVDDLAGLGSDLSLGRPRTGRVHVQPGRHPAAGRFLGQADVVRCCPGC